MDFSKLIDKSNNKKISLNFVVGILLPIAVMAFFLLCKDKGAVDSLRWLFMIFVLSFLMRGFLTIRNMPLWDNGFGLSFGLGLALSFFLSFLISSNCHIEFGNALCFFCLVCLTLLRFLYGKFLAKNAYKWSLESFSRFLLGFSCFCIIFAFAFWVIGFNPLVDSGTENYMDYGFMQSIFRQKQLAPFDLWFAGEKLNYYYLGQAACVYLTRLSFTTPEYGYNLSLATFWGMVFVMTGEITFGIVGKVKTNLNAYVAAFVTSLYCTFAGNGHWLVFGLIKPLLDRIQGNFNDGSRYWFPDGTVYISSELGDIDNGKNEFPAYSAILGDLHAHVINVLFVLPLVALILDYAFSKKEEKDKSNIVLCGILLALYKGSNYWDFAIYFVIVGAVVVFSDLAQSGLSLKTIGDIFVNALIVVGISYFAILPFSLQFQKMSSQICIANTHSPVYKLAVLWFFPIAVAIIFIIRLLIRKESSIGFEKGARFGLLAFSLCAIGLVITPEFIYIKDIYGEGYTRFNTMFKLTYQAFILLGIIIGCTCGILMNDKESKKRNWFLTINIVIITVCLSTYSLHGIRDWFGDISESNNRKGISSIETLEEDDDYFPEIEVAKIINQDTREVVNIIEAAGLSYTHSDALSVLTGANTVCGWFTHEWMWRDNPEIVNERSIEIRQFYESGNLDFNKKIIQKYNIDYVFVGPSEYNNYHVDLDGIENLGQVQWKALINGKCMELVRIK